MTQTPGWYEDPQDPSQLRYWDGVIWSDHVTPKASPTVEPSPMGAPFSGAPAAARPEGFGSHGAQGGPAAPGGSGPYQKDQGQGQGGDQWPVYGQAPMQAPGQQQGGWQSHPSTTPDGVPLSGWWLRVGARLLDNLFVNLVSLPFTFWFLYRFFVAFGQWAEEVVDSTNAAPTVPVVAFPPWEVFQYLVAWVVIVMLITGAYEVFFLTRFGATPGKMLVGISVRLRDRPGPPPLKTALGRTACYLGFQLISPANLLDDLWPLWDEKKQALHDKPVGTNVVIGPQPRRNA